MNNYKKMREYTHEEFINLISNMSEEELLSCKKLTRTLDNFLNNR